MADAGLIIPEDGPPFGLGQLYRLSFDGHDFVLDIRQDGVLDRVKTQFGEKLSEVSWSVLKAAVTNVAVNLATRGFTG